MAIRPVYGPDGARRRTPRVLSGRGLSGRVLSGRVLSGRVLSDGAVLAGAIAAVAGAVAARWWVGLAVAGLVAVVLTGIDRRAARWMCLAVLLVGAAGGWRGAVAWQDLEPRRLGPHHGWVEVVTEPRAAATTHPRGGQGRGQVIRVLLEVDGQRFESWVRDERHRAVAAGWRGGQRVELRGERRPLRPERARRVAWQHVVGEYRISTVGRADPGSGLAQVSNRVRASIERGAAVLGDDAALYRGLVIGDRSGQPPELVERFRASGLSHLTVVSGLNVSLLLVAAGPGLVRLRPLARWTITLLLVAWFVSLTRFEPSIVRAGTMAAISATAFATGRDRAAARILGVAVILLVLVDPLLVRSVGWWLSVGATAGVCVLGPRLAARLGALGPLATPLGVTLGAQIGVVVPLVAAFGSIPVASVPANLLAVPVASLVKLYGLPAGLVAGWLPPVAGPVMLPVRLGVRWVDRVALVSAGVEPGAPWSWIAWAVLLAGVAGVILVGGAKHPHRDVDPPAHRRRRVDRPVRRPRPGPPTGRRR